MNTKKRKLVRLSLDAMIKEDVEYLFDKPLVKKILQEGVWIKTLRTVYPANTYPCHASMITGAYPYKTGVDTNYYDNTTDWRVERSNIKIKTLIDYAKEAGYTTANVFWPVMAGDKNIDYNIAEFPSHYNNLIPKLKEGGTSDDVLEKVVNPNMHFLEEDKNMPHNATHFIFSCAKDMLLQYKPDILLIHPCPLDDQRHKDGVFSDGVTDALELSYKYIEELYDAIKQNGDEDNTDFVWMSDHGQFTIEYWYRFLVELKDAGLIDAGKNGEPITKSVSVKIFNSSLMLKALDKNAYDKLLAIINDSIARKTGITVYTHAEAVEKLHTDGDFDFLIDTDGSCGIGKEACLDNLGNIYSTVAPNVKRKVGTHGYSPDIMYQPTLLAIGPDFNKNVVLERVETVNVPVTIAKCLGLVLQDADGIVIDEILK
jgi:predicted AlkP superfamily pyrophosphatase or phosphodiesterase